MKKTFIFISLIFILSISAVAQTKKKSSSKKTTKTTATTTTNTTKTTEELAPVTQTPPKKNERPEAQITPQQTEPKKKNQAERNITATKAEKIIYPYNYEFSQPNFLINKILIEHDETGKGTITFTNKDFEESITDPIQLSHSTLKRLNKLFDSLNFISSTEIYQSSERDYSHLGNHTITLRKDKMERSAKYNWTENEDAKALADEYHKIREQYIWSFDITVARQNQPLATPDIVERLDSLLKRNEISDPPQMLPFLKELSIDERIPLIARNKIIKIIKDIEKNLQKQTKQ